MARKTALKSLVRVRLLFLLVLACSLDDLALPPFHNEVLAHFPESSGLWWTHYTFPVWYSLYNQYYFPSLVCFPTPPFGSSIIYGGLPWCRLVLPFFGYLSDFHDIFFESPISFWSTPTRDRFCTYLGSLVEHLPEVRSLLYFFSAADLT